MKQQYKEVNFKGDSLGLIQTMDAIVASYMKQGYVLTVRQLYYQLVAQALVPNTENSYKRITSLVNDARLAGLIDWSGIEDRTRSFIRRGRWNSGKEILETCADSYHMDMWKNQSNRLFVIVEKEALAGVLEGVCFNYDVPLLAARGYPSGTVLREFVENDVLPVVGHWGGSQRVQILHLGDHDPSGIDMTRDLRERIDLFADSLGNDYSIELTRIALSMTQIEEVKPPPNPAKTTDARFSDYRRRYGDKSWELDALTPQYLNTLVRSHITKYIDDDAWAERVEQIAQVKSRMREIANEFEEV